MSKASRVKTSRVRRRTNASPAVSTPMSITFPILKSPQSTKKKTGKSRKIEIKAHQRTLHEYVYGGVCKNCDNNFERISDGFKFPTYCDFCACLSPEKRIKYQPKKNTESQYVVIKS